MSALAALTRRLGVRVSGSDREESKTLRDLVSLGVDARVGHFPETVSGAALVVYSLAVKDDDPELRRAADEGILTVSRAEYLGALMLRYGTRIGVSGSHGKSTVTAMLGRIFSMSYRHPTVLSGAPLSNNSSYLFGGEDVLIYEACEYRGAFLSFSPSIALILNVDFDHPDCYASLGEIEDAFVSSSEGAALSVVNIDSEAALRVYQRIKGRKISVGKSMSATYRYEIVVDNPCPTFNIYHMGAWVAALTLSVIGEHSAANATAAFAVASEYGIAQRSIRSSLECFSGIARRAELVGKFNGCPVYYDYAHHPSEIRASIEALRKLHPGKITVVFKPHTYTRTMALFSDFVSSLSLADRVILTEIYPARESPIPNVTSERLAEEIGGRASFSADSSVFDALSDTREGTIVLMGAGNMDEIKRKIAGNG